MKRMFLLAAMLALFAGVTGAYAWDTQATDEQMSYQSFDYPNESSGRY